MGRTLLVSLVLCGGCAAAPPVQVLTVGPKELTGELRRCLVHFGAAVDEAESADALLDRDLGRYRAVAVCVPMRDRPLELTQAQSEALLHFVEGGGRAYVEYARFADGAMPGWTVAADPVLDRFERLAVMRDDLLGTGLKRDDLLEEHNSYLLDIAPPPDAEVLLKYGLFMGTYEVAWDIEDIPTFFVITVDLGEERPLSRAGQWYGGLDPGYVPDDIRVSLAGEDGALEQAGAMGLDGLEDLRALFDLGGRTARYVRFYAEKQASCRPMGDFLVLGGIEVYDGSGVNVALNRPYTFQAKKGEPQQVEGGPLTRGEKPRPWSQDRTHLYPAPPKRGLNEYRWNGLMSWRHGEGRLYYAATSLSAFRAHNFRLTRRWEDLVRGLTLALLPESERDAAQRRRLPLEAHTYPRRWVVPGDPVELRVSSSPGVEVRIVSEGLAFDPVAEVEPGRYVARCAAPAEGDYALRVRVSRGEGWNEETVPLSVRPRASMYRRALDRSMAWFLNSGTMPKDDGSEGIRSTLEIGALYAGKAEDLPSAFRADCQAMCGKAFYLYGDLSGDTRWHRRAENLAGVLMRCQFTEPGNATCGAFKWMPEGNDAIYPQDDNNRNAEFLSWLYTRTGHTAYLESALAAVEFARDTAREDWTLSYWVTDPATVEARGRFALRGANGFSNVSDWCLFRHHYAYRATGDPLYLEALRGLSRIYGHATATPGALDHLPHSGQHERLGERGLAIALQYLDPADPLRSRLVGHVERLCTDYLARDDVRRYGFMVQPGDIGAEEIGYAYNNDCSIHTRAGEPLSDQLYTTASTALRRWESYKAAPGDVTRRAAESILDYLVRIQMENPDPRLDGCWLRSFDMERWEYYGTRYDPNYGAYHAYTGWMNSMAATALAYYLHDENPLEARTECHDAAEAVLEGVRHRCAPEYLREVNRIQGLELNASVAPDLGSRTPASVTDGVVEGHWSDDLSAGWSPAADGSDLQVVLTGSLREPAPCRRIGVRVGGLDNRCFADRLLLEGGPSAAELRPILDVALMSNDGMNWFEFNEQVLRHVRITLVKRHTGQPLYVGEIRLIELEP